MKKINDDYKAKFKLWAQSPKVYPSARIKNLPHFGHKCFKSYEELNEWKKDLFEKLAKDGGAKWTT